MACTRMDKIILMITCSSLLILQFLFLNTEPRACHSQVAKGSVRLAEVNVDAKDTHLGAASGEVLCKTVTTTQRHSRNDLQIFYRSTCDTGQVSGSVPAAASSLASMRQEIAVIAETLQQTATFAQAKRLSRLSLEQRHSLNHSLL